VASRFTPSICLTVRRRGFLIANGVEVPAVGAGGGLALQPFATKLPR